MTVGSDSESIDNGGDTAVVIHIVVYDNLLLLPVSSQISSTASFIINYTLATVERSSAESFNHCHYLQYLSLEFFYCKQKSQIGGTYY